MTTQRSSSTVVRSAMLAGGLTLAGAIMVMAGLHQHGKITDPDPVYQPVGYIRQVEDFIRNGVILINPSTGEIELASNLDQNTQAWIGKSRLKTDIKDFNDAVRRGREPAGGFLRRLGNDIRVVRHSHNMNFALQSTRYRWTGRMLFAPTSNQINMELNSGHTSLRILQSGASQPLSPLQVNLPCDGAASSGRPHEGQVLRLFLQKRGRSTHPRAGQLFYVGKSLVFTAGPASDGVEAIWNSQRVDPGMQVRLEPNDVLMLSDVNSPSCFVLFTVSGGASGGIISAPYRTNGLIERRASSSTPPGLDGLADAIDGAVARDRRPVPGVNFDVYLTLNETLQTQVQEILDNYYDTRNWTAANGTVAAGITIMDASTGRLLTLASKSEAADRDNDQRKRRLLRNQNFVGHGIGSTVKPLLAAAILDVRPEFAGLRRPAYPQGTVKSIGPFSLPKELNNADPYGTTHQIDFANFLIHSSNAYMADMAVLALLRNEPILGSPHAGSSPTGYWLGGKPVLSFDRSSDYIVANPGPGQPELTVYEPGLIPPFLERFSDLYAVPLLETAQQREDPETWTVGDYKLINAVYERLGSTPALLEPFDDVIPDAPNAKLERIRNLRYHFISFILGDYENRWTNVHLAQAFNRLTTGRRIDAQLIHAVVDAGTLPEVEPLQQQAVALPIGIDDTGRAAVLQAISRVATEGTAKSLAKTVEDIQRTTPDFVLYAKTGTPVGNMSRSSGVFVFTAGLRGAARPGHPADYLIKDGVTVAIHVEDRGGSPLAVELGKQVIETIARSKGWLRG